MKVSVLGNGLTGLTLAQSLVNQGIKVDIFSEKNILNAYCYIVPYKNSETNQIRIHFTKNKPIKYLKNLLNQNLN